MTLESRTEPAAMWAELVKKDKRNRSRNTNPGRDTKVPIGTRG